MPSRCRSAPAFWARIRAWQDWYETNEDWRGDMRFDIDGFSREGLAIARAAKAELPDWTIVYFDEAAMRRHMDGPRHLYEYEIVGGARWNGIRGMRR